MKTTTAIFFLMATITLAKCQPVTFEKTVDYDHAIENGKSVVAIDDGYVFWGGGGGDPSIDYWEGMKLFKVDTQGNFVWKKFYGKRYFNYYSGYYGNLVKTSDGGFAACGSENDSVSQIFAATLFRFDENGDTLWIARLNNHVQQAFQNCEETLDHGFIMTGIYTNTINGIEKIYLAKIDSLGNFEWEQAYPINGYGNNVTPTDDGGYIIGGTKEKFSGHNAGMIIKTDSVGNIQWQKTYATVSGFDGNVLVTKSRYGGYMVCATLDTVINPGDYEYACLISHIDSAGNPLWEKYVTSPSNNLLQIYNLQELADGSIILAGDKALQDTSFEYGMIIKLDSAGNQLWERLNYHTTLNGTVNGPNDIYDLKQAPDGGFICTGIAFDVAILNDGHYDSNTNFWLLKTDSLGYVYYPVDTDTTDTTGIVVLPQDKLKVYPNPANQQLIIETDTPNQTTFLLYNIMGQAVIEKQLTETKTLLDISTLPQGLYLYRIGKQKGKVLVVH